MELTSIAVSLTVARKTPGPGEQKLAEVTVDEVRDALHYALKDLGDFAEIGEISIGKVGQVATLLAGTAVGLNPQIEQSIARDVGRTQQTGRSGALPGGPGGTLGGTQLMSLRQEEDAPFDIKALIEQATKDTDKSH